MLDFLSGSNNNFDISQWTEDRRIDLKMSLEEAEALGVDLEYCADQRNAEALARWNAVKRRRETGATIRDRKVVEEIAEIIGRM